MAKAEQRQRPNQRAPLVEPRRQADGVGKAQPGTSYRQDGVVAAEERLEELRRQRDAGRESQQPGRQPMGALGIEAEEQGSEQSIKQGHRPPSFVLGPSSFVQTTKLFKPSPGRDLLPSLFDDIPQIEHRPIATEQSRALAQLGGTHAARAHAADDRPLQQSARKAARPAIPGGTNSIAQRRELL